MKQSKNKILDLVCEKLKKQKSIEFSFISNEKEYVCISLDIFGSGKPEVLALGCDDYHTCMAISNNQKKNIIDLKEMFQDFSDELEMMIIPNEYYYNQNDFI